MSSTAIGSTAVSRSAFKPADAVLKVIVFQIAGYRLAVPMASVLRVVNTPPEMHDSLPDTKGQSSLLELIHLGHHAIAVLNLYPHLSLKQVNSSPQQGQFLVVTKAGEELCAIRVDVPPDLLELDVATIRELPTPYRQGHPLSIASRVAVLPQGKATLAIFLLDMERVLQMIKD
jgi:chemotaxis signal transduction protein